MSLQLHFGPGACSFVPHTLLEATGAPYEPVLVKLHKQEHLGEAFRALNPRGQVPVLVDGGAVITQIVAIVTYLHERFPEQRFLPSDPLAKARVLETLGWMNSAVHPTFAHIFLPHKFTDDPALHAPLRRHNTTVYAESLSELQALVAQAQDRGDAFLGGAHFGPLDAYALTLLRWGSMSGIDPARYPVLWAHVQRVAELPPVARVLARERVPLNLFSPA